MFPLTDGGSTEMKAGKRQLGRLPRTRRIPRLPMAFGDLFSLRAPARTGRKPARKGGVGMLLALSLLRFAAGRRKKKKARDEQG